MVWGFSDHLAPRVLQNCIHRFYLRVHRFASVAAISIEMVQPMIRTVQWMEMLRCHNQIMHLPDGRWPKIVYNYDVAQCKNMWISEIDHICLLLHLSRPKEQVEYDFEVVYQAMCKYSRDRWWREASQKSKLRSFIEFKDRTDPTVLVKNNLLRHQGSLLAKLSCGILPLEIETRRYSGVSPEHRYCGVCNLDAVKDEYHFLYSCPLLQPERSRFYVDHISNLEEFML